MSITVTEHTGDVSALHNIWEEGFASVNAAYSLPPATFESLLAAALATVFVARLHASDEPVGFALTYLIRSGGEGNPAAQHYKGSLAALVVHPRHRGCGVGGALHDAALTSLETSVRSSFARSTPPPTEGELQLGSIFPRIFPGLPVLDELKPTKEWFTKRGWTFPGSQAIDLYGRVPTGVDQEQWKEDAKAHGITFRPANPDDEAAVMVLEKEFDSYTGWPDMFPRFFAAGKAGDIHLAFSRDGEVIGATLAALAPSPLHDVVAWPATLGEQCGKQCAAIACVGVSVKARGTGAGTGICASALQDLEARGADGCFIDWVGMKGFYERFGLERWQAPYWDGGRKVLPRT